MIGQKALGGYRHGWLVSVSKPRSHTRGERLQNAGEMERRRNPAGAQERRAKKETLVTCQKEKKTTFRCDVCLSSNIYFFTRTSPERGTNKKILRRVCVGRKEDGGRAAIRDKNKGQEDLVAVVVGPDPVVDIKK
jgi:hypothetical protein